MKNERGIWQRLKEVAKQRQLPDIFATFCITFYAEICLQSPHQEWHSQFWVAPMGNTVAAMQRTTFVDDKLLCSLLLLLLLLLLGTLRCVGIGNRLKWSTWKWPVLKCEEQQQQYATRSARTVNKPDNCQPPAKCKQTKRHFLARINSVWVAHTHTCRWHTYIRTNCRWRWLKVRKVRKVRFFTVNSIVYMTAIALMDNTSCMKCCWIHHATLNGDNLCGVAVLSGIEAQNFSRIAVNVLR